MAIVGTVDGKATRRHEHLFGRSGVPVRPIFAVMAKLREIFPDKTAAHIACRARVSTRSAEYWLADGRGMSAEAFINLLYTDEGAAILETIMKTLPERDRPRWWARHRHTAELVAIEHAQALQEERIKQLRLDLAQK